jgi:DNA-binding transcriptional LysR family regulator
LPPGHRLLAQTVVTLQDLATEPLVLLDTARTREYMLSAFSADGVVPRIAHRVYSMTMLLGLVESGHGFSLLNFCPPNTQSRPLKSSLRTPNFVVAHSHRYRFTSAAAAVVEIVGALAETLAFDPD